MLLLHKDYFNYDNNHTIRLIIDSKIYVIELKNNIHVKLHSNKVGHPNYVDYNDKDWYPYQLYGHVTHADYDFYYIYVVE